MYLGGEEPQPGWTYPSRASRDSTCTCECRLHRRRVARQEHLTRLLRADLDQLASLAESIPSLRSRMDTFEFRQPTGSVSAPSPAVRSPKKSVHGVSPFDSGIRDQSDTGAVRHNIRLSAIEELEQGHIPTNALGNGARMLGLPDSGHNHVSGSRKRKHGSELADAKIAFTM